MHNLAAELEANQAKLKSKHKSSGLQDVTQKEMKLLEKINQKLVTLKAKASSKSVNGHDISDEEEDE